jgi:two-component system, LytTR family, sensor histidine kinase AlgZ
MKRSFSVRGMLLTDTYIGLLSPALVFWFGPKFTWELLIANIFGGQIYAHTIGTLAHLSMMSAYPRIAHWKFAARWSAVIVLLASVTAVGCCIAITMMSLVGLQSFANFWDHFRRAFQIGFVLTVVFGASGAVIETMKGKLEWATSELRKQELERERALKLALEARLSSLESRVHPHFLFNALNSISSLIREDPDRAERLIERLAALLRFSLDSNQMGFVTIGQETEVVRGYLDIEKARFGDRLQFSIDIPADLRGYTVPPLAIQTLVENSVKYAIAPKREGGAITVTASLVNGGLAIQVWDEGPGVDLRSLPAGHGLDLLESRLQTLYDGAASLSAKGSSVTISLPCSLPISSMTKS